MRRSLLSRTVMSRSDFFVVLGSEAYEFGEVERAIWQLSDGSRTVSDIAKSVSTEFAVPPETADADVSAFVDELIESGLVERVQD